VHNTSMWALATSVQNKISCPNNQRAQQYNTCTTRALLTACTTSKTWTLNLQHTHNDQITWTMTHHIPITHTR